MLNHMKSIKKIAHEIGVTYQAVYKRIKREPLSSKLQSHIRTFNRTLYIDIDGEDLIKAAYSKNGGNRLVYDNVHCNVQGDVNTVLQEVNEFLRKQLEMKDRQILSLIESNKILAENAKRGKTYKKFNKTTGHQPTDTKSISKPMLRLMNYGAK